MTPVVVEKFKRGEQKDRPKHLRPLALFSANGGLEKCRGARSAPESSLHPQTTLSWGGGPLLTTYSEGTEVLGQGSRAPMAGNPWEHHLLSLL